MNTPKEDIYRELTIILMSSAYAWYYEDIFFKILFLLCIPLALYLIYKKLIKNQE